MAELWIETPVGACRITARGGAIVGLTIGERPTEPTPTDDDPLLSRAARELEEYFRGARQSFGLPLHPAGRALEQRVWRALGAIPYGKTRTYGEIAAEIGSPRAARAVGGANHRNPIMILIPCHRVVGAGGALTGFRAGIPVKKYLLDLERGAGL